MNIKVIKGLNRYFVVHMFVRGQLPLKVIKGRKKGFNILEYRNNKHLVKMISYQNITSIKMFYVFDTHVSYIKASTQELFIFVYI